tara:strand:- start:260567 stop:262018 length:1452 start_codon:yes stop_codon:yes gene_type:complete
MAIRFAISITYIWKTMNFTTIGLKQSLVNTVERTGYTIPTPIQAASVPAILSGKDVLAAAQTGTGKTAGFTLPMLQLLSASKTQLANKQVRALVLTPTRELAAQVHESVLTYGKGESLKSAVVFGGVNISPQRRALAEGVDILVATPGRLLDLYQQKNVKLDAVEILVLDEADRMLDMGFIHDIKRILNLLPKVRQNLMFSATFSNPIRELAKKICHQPVEIDVAPRNSTLEAISQQLYHVGKEKKIAFLSQYLSGHADQALVFSRTKHGADKLTKKLKQANIQASAIHGNKSQNQRTKALQDFKENRVQVLVATDIAARGIDIDQLALVVNFDLPQVAEDYVHRIGRTGRAGATGLAVSLVSPDERKQLRAIETLLKQQIPVMEIEFDLGEQLTQAPVSEAEHKPANKPRSRHQRRNPHARQAQGNPEQKRPGKRRRRPAENSQKPGGSGNAKAKQQAASGQRDNTKRSGVGQAFQSLFRFN